MRPILKTALAGVMIAMALPRCATPTLESGTVRGDAMLPHTRVFFVREFEEGNDWLSADGTPAARPEILAHLSALTTKMRDRFERLGPTRALMTSIPKEGILVTGQLTRVRDGQQPQVEGRILIYDLARSYHYPVTVFEFHPSPEMRARTLDEFWDLIARTSVNFVRERMQP